MSQTNKDELEFVITAADYVQRDGRKDYRDRIRTIAANLIRKHSIEHFPTEKIKGDPVLARIDFERWIADCPDPLCNGAEIVDLDDPIFFCLSCGNAANSGNYYPISFPPKSERLKIYTELRTRPLKTLNVKDRVRKAETAVPEVPGLARSWSPGETIKDLRDQKKFAEEMIAVIRERQREQGGNQ